MRRLLNEWRADSGDDLFPASPGYIALAIAGILVARRAPRVTVWA